MLEKTLCFLLSAIGQVQQDVSGIRQRLKPTKNSYRYTTLVIDGKFTVYKNLKLLHAETVFSPPRAIIPTLCV